VGGAKDCAGSGVVNALTKCTDGFDLKGNLCIPKIGSTSLSNMSVLELMKKVMNWILSILAVLTIIALVISGVRYLVSAGDEEMAATAKRNLTYAIVGLAIALSGLIIVNAIAGLLGAG
jgi:succinate dehydrogenase/fumarate reductase cytochrome b subunit